MKKLIVVLVVLAVLAIGAIAQVNPYQQPEKVDRFGAITSALEAVIVGDQPRATEITAKHLDLLQALTNNNMSRMSALFFALPIRSWAHLYSVQYVSFDSKTGQSQRVVDSSAFFLWSCLFALPLGDAAHPAILNADGVAINPWNQ